MPVNEVKVPASIISAVFSADKKFLYTSLDKTVAVFKVVKQNNAGAYTFTSVETIKGYSYMALSLSMANDTTHFYTSNYGGYIHKWNISKGEIESVFKSLGTVIYIC